MSEPGTIDQAVPDVRLRDSNPSARDALGGAHGRIAAAIAALIDSCPGGKSLAIMGGWGSGKSTIVSLLRKQLHPIATRVFVFDAWSHQGDPIRRSFLESFFDFLAAESWLKKDAPFGKLTLQDEVRRTTGRSDIVTTKTRKALGPWGVAAAIVTLLDAGAVNILPKWDPSKPDTRIFLYVDIALVVLPFLVFLAAWLRGRSASRSFMELLVKDAEEEKTVETAKTLDSTSIDFRRLFCALCSRALDPLQRRLVIVIDNLDRIDPAEALAMWASMRTFFDFNDAPKLGASPDWVSRVWLIVPLDRSALQRLWKQDDSKATQQLIEAFVAKTFDIVYDIPNVTLTRQKQFFQDELRDAIPGQTDAAYDSVYLLTDRYRAQLSTPREIKLFLNRLASLHLQWQGEIALPLLALYVLVPDALNPKEPVPPAVLDLFDEAQRGQWQRAIAAIQFNVPLDDAGEAIDGPRILQALEASQPIAEELHKRKWFWEVCARVVRDRTSEWEAGPDLLANSILSLHRLAQPETPGEIALANQIWDSICDTAKRSTAWKISEPFVDGIFTLIGHSGQSDDAKLGEKLLDTAQNGAKPAANDKLLADWVRGAVRIFNRWPHLRADYSIELLEQWPQAMLVPGASAHLPRFRPADPKQALLALAQLGFQGAGGDAIFTLIDAMKGSGQWPWAELANVEAPWQKGEDGLDKVARGVRILLAADPNASQPRYGPFSRLRVPQTVSLIAEGEAVKRHADAARIAFAFLSDETDPNKVQVTLAGETAAVFQELLGSLGRFDLAITMALSNNEPVCAVGRTMVNNLAETGRGGELSSVADRGLAGLALLLEKVPDFSFPLAAQLVQTPSFVDRLRASLGAVQEDRLWVAIHTIFENQSFPGREQLLQEILEGALSRVSALKLLRIEFGFRLLLALFRVAGTAWLPLSVARDLHNTEVSAADEPQLNKLLTRRIEIGDRTTEQLLDAAASDAALYDLAIDRAQSDAALNPDDAGVQLAWGRALALRKSPLAEQRFRRALELEPDDVEARKCLAETLLEAPASRAALDEAIALLNELDEPLLAGRAALAHANLNIGADFHADTDTAIENFRAALAEQPTNIDAQAGLAMALSDKAQRSTGADAGRFFEEARQQFASISDPPPEVLIQFGRALVAEARAGGA